MSRLICVFIGWCVMRKIERSGSKWKWSPHIILFSMDCRWQSALPTYWDWKLCYWIIDAISLCLQWIEFKLRSLVAYSNVLWLYLHKSLYKMYVEKMMTLNRYICVHTPHNGFAKTHNYISRLEAKIIFDGKVNSRLFPILMGIIVSSAFSVLRAVKLITKSSLSACFNNTIRLKAYRAYIFSNPTFWLTL